MKRLLVFTLLFIALAYIPISSGVDFDPSRIRKCYDIAPKIPRPQPAPFDPSVPHPPTYNLIGINPPQFVCVDNDEDKPQPSLGHVIRTKEFTLYSAPSTKSKLIQNICGLAELDVLCQIKGWSQVTGLSPIARATKPLWAVLDGGKQIEGVPICNGTEPEPLPQNFTQKPKECSRPAPVPKLSPIAPCNVTSNGRAIATAARWAVTSERSINYSQGPNRWSGITQRICPFSKAPLVAADASSFVTWLYWTSFGKSRDFLNNQNWKAGSIATMSKNGVPVSLARARQGDVVFYGPRTAYNHVAVYVGNNQVVSFGKDGRPKLMKINYRPDYSVRTYLPEDKRRRI